MRSEHASLSLGTGFPAPSFPAGGSALASSTSLDRRKSHRSRLPGGTPSHSGPVGIAFCASSSSKPSAKPIFLRRSCPHCVNHWVATQRWHSKTTPSCGGVSRALLISQYIHLTGGYHPCFTPKNPSFVLDIVRGPPWVRHARRCFQSKTPRLGAAPWRRVRFDNKTHHMLAGR